MRPDRTGPVSYPITHIKGCVTTYVKGPYFLFGKKESKQRKTVLETSFLEKKKASKEKPFLDTRFLEKKKVSKEKPF